MEVEGAEIPAHSLQVQVSRQHLLQHCSSRQQVGERGCPTSRSRSSGPAGTSRPSTARHELPEPYAASLQYPSDAAPSHMQSDVLPAKSERSALLIRQDKHAAHDE